MGRLQLSDSTVILGIYAIEKKVSLVTITDSVNKSSQNHYFQNKALSTVDIKKNLISTDQRLPTFISVNQN